MEVKRGGEVLTLEGLENVRIFIGKIEGCLLYTSDAADE